MIPMQNDDWELFARELLEKLGVPLDSVKSGSVGVELTGGDEHATVTWNGFARMPADDFRDMFNRFKIRQGEA